MNDKCYACGQQVGDDCVMISHPELGLRFVCSLGCVDAYIAKWEEMNAEKKRAESVYGTEELLA